MYAESLEFHLLFYKLFLEIQIEKTNSLDVGRIYEFFSGNLCENKDICPKNTEIQYCIFSKKSGNLTASMRGRANFFWNSPLNPYQSN